MKSLNNYINESKISKLYHKFMDAITGQPDGEETAGILDEPKDKLSKLPKEAIFRLAIDMCCLMYDGFYKKMPTQEDAERMFYDNEYLLLTLGRGNKSKYLDEILRVMKGCYLSCIDKQFAYNYNGDPSLLNKDEFITLDEYINLK